MQLKYRFPMLAIISIASIYSCSNKKNAYKQVDAFQPTATYKPAFEGQTNIKAVTTTTPYQVEKIAEKLGRPWAIIPMPDGRLMITEKSGFITIHSADGLLLKKITGLPKVEDDGQGGLLDVIILI